MAKIVQLVGWLVGWLVWFGLVWFVGLLVAGLFAYLFAFWLTDRLVGLAYRWRWGLCRWVGEVKVGF